jgi:uncharacterized protein with ParB-like and HNH nuclease domain
MEIIPDKRKVVRLVEQAYGGEICLPNFQRDFVWTREEVADLVRSIVRGYFIGSLLLLRCEKNNPPFAPVFLRGAEPNVRDPRPELLVLDGQQRLSALIYALTGPDLSLKDSSQRRWYFLDLDPANPGAQTFLTPHTPNTRCVSGFGQRSKWGHIYDPGP